MPSANTARPVASHNSAEGSSTPEPSRAINPAALAADNGSKWAAWKTRWGTPAVR
ncbi:hypothetical protein [Streptomyces montanus]|uniref:hypothetical protein n=1 Tax=Streptomyces montanus TaxID=2580423 RepID=UPI0014867882|nr:hypothetical protein [Streptomyces montanus]